MDIEYGKRLLLLFIKVFTVLFIILVLMPWMLDHVIRSINGGIQPVNDSIKVFKDNVAGSAAISRFLSMLKKVIIFM